MVRWLRLQWNNCLYSYSLRDLRAFIMVNSVFYGWWVVLCRRDLYCESMPFIRQDAAWWWYRNCYIWLFVTVVEMRNKCKIWTKSGRMWNISALLMLCFPANCCECLWSNSGRWCGAVWSVMWGATLHRGRGGRPSVCRAGRAGTRLQSARSWHWPAGRALSPLLQCRVQCREAAMLLTPLWWPAAAQDSSHSNLPCCTTPHDYWTLLHTQSMWSENYKKIQLWSSLNIFCAVTVLFLSWGAWTLNMLFLGHCLVSLSVARFSKMAAD